MIVNIKILTLISKNPIKVLFVHLILSRRNRQVSILLNHEDSWVKPLVQRCFDTEHCLQSQFLISQNDEALLENQQGFPESYLPYFA